MSHYGRETGTGLEMTAIGFRNLYLLDGNHYEGFECPFCEIPLIGKNLYHQEIVLRPHFATRAGEGHEYGCNGYPIGGRPPRQRPQVDKVLKKYSFIPRGVLFPEELADERPDLAKRPRKGKSATLSEAEVTKRRGAVSPETITAGAYKAPVVRAFAETWSTVVSACFAHARSTTNVSPSALIKEVLSAIPLSLPGNRSTNYQDGFPSTKFLVDLPCIYQGNGTVTEESTKFVIESAIKTKLSSGREVDALVIVEKPAVGEKTTKPHQKILDDLQLLANTKVNTKWFAFGTMCQYENGRTICQLSVKNLNWLHVYQK